MKLAGKVAVITGAGSGIGRGSALMFAREGARIVVVDIDEKSAAESVDQIKAQGGEALAITADVSKPDDAKAMVDAALKRWGAVDILYNNAATEGPICFAAQLSVEQFDEVIGINLRGTWLGMKYALPAMMARRSGSILNVGSLAGLRATPGGAAYCASKFAVVGITQAVAIEYGKYNIRANCIIPGWIETPMVHRLFGGTLPESSVTAPPLRRIGQPEDVAKAALFLVSEDANYITGTVFTVDGGINAGDRGP
ncbi:MAG TPA: SDR family NAD(P)-dependent oxidoreductase [Candidatus Binataceae bacterium]|nr:SDR family NAD(P)-dependent oxidoreductase [Candidatus Binataceae bacterium]